MNYKITTMILGIFLLIIGACFFLFYKETMEVTMNELLTYNGYECIENSCTKTEENVTGSLTTNGSVTYTKIDDNNVEFTSTYPSGLTTSETTTKKLTQNEDGTFTKTANYFETVDGKSVPKTITYEITLNDDKTITKDGVDSENPAETVKVTYKLNEDGSYTSTEVTPENTVTTTYGALDILDMYLINLLKY